MVESTYNWYWLVDGPAGETLIKQVAAVGVCGFSVRADLFKDYSDMGDFVKNVFLAEVVKPVSKPMDSDGNGVTDHMGRCLDTSQGVRVDARGLDTEKEP